MFAQPQPQASYAMGSTQFSTLNKNITSTHGATGYSHFSQLQVKWISLNMGTELPGLTSRLLEAFGWFLEHWNIGGGELDQFCLAL